MWQSTDVARRSPAQAVSALVGIWGAVLAISLFAPDMVSGSEQQHLPVAAFGTWILGAVASRGVMATLLRLDGEGAALDQLRGQLVRFVAAVWTVAALVAILGPEMVTGSDPTRLPIAALLAPVAATVLNTGACATASAFGSATSTVKGFHSGATSEHVAEWLSQQPQDRH